MWDLLRAVNWNNPLQLLSGFSGHFACNSNWKIHLCMLKIVQNIRNSQYNAITLTRICKGFFLFVLSVNRKLMVYKDGTNVTISSYDINLHGSIWNLKGAQYSMI